MCTAHALRMLVLSLSALFYLVLPSHCLYIKHRFGYSVHYMCSVRYHPTDITSFVSLYDSDSEYILLRRVLRTSTFLLLLLSNSKHSYHLSGHVVIQPVLHLQDKTLRYGWTC